MLMLILFIVAVLSIIGEGDTSIIPSGLILIVLCLFLWWYLGKLQKKRMGTTEKEMEPLENAAETEPEEQFSEEELAMVP